MGQRTCLTKGCRRPHHARGVCISCYDRLRRIGNLPPIQPELPIGIVHRISEYDAESRRGTCEVCGPGVRVRIRTDTASCKNRGVHRSSRPDDWRWKIKYRYGITADEYQALLVAQNGACAICLKSPEANSKRLAVDHCHESSRVRGLLCSTCNRAVGLLGDDPANIERAWQYLK